MRSLSPTISSIFALLTTSTLAQDANSTTPTNGTCNTPRYDLDAPVNASAVVPVNVTSEPWYLTVSLNDTRTNTTASTSVYGWLSTPENSTGQACVYWLTDVLAAQSSGTPNGGCAGSLSENCVDFMRRSIVLGGNDCPSLPSREAFGKACGGSALADGYQGNYVSPSLHFSRYLICSCCAVYIFPVPILFPFHGGRDAMLNHLHSYIYLQTPQHNKRNLHRPPRSRRRPTPIILHQSRTLRRRIQRR